MLTGAEKGYLAMTLFFLATGSGIKAYRHASVEVGPSHDSLMVDREALSGEAAQIPYSIDREEIPGAQADSSPASPAEGGDSPGRSPADAPDIVRDSEPPGPQARKSSGPGRKADFAGKVSINRADAQELTSVRGLGDKTARAIIEHRRIHGPYRQLRDLLQVKGIGEKKLEKLIPYLIL